MILTKWIDDTRQSHPGSPNAFLMIRSDPQIRTQMRIDQDGATTSTSLIATANHLGASVWNGLAIPLIPII